MCMYLHIHTYIHTYTYTCVYVYVHRDIGLSRGHTCLRPRVGAAARAWAAQGPAQHVPLRLTISRSLILTLTSHVPALDPKPKTPEIHLSPRGLGTASRAGL